MNSEQWEQLWREQGESPASAVNIDRFHEQMRRQPEEWEGEVDDQEWFGIRLGLVCVLLAVPEVFLRDFRWDRWLVLLGYLTTISWYLLRRFERRRIYGDFGLPMKERLDRMERLLRARHAGWLNIALPAGGLLVWALVMADRLGWVMGLVVAAVFLVGMGYSLRVQNKIDQARLEAALQRIERVRAQLGHDRMDGGSGLR